jgi:hypothetical protein
MHSPEAAELRREASRKGGRNRSAKARAAAEIPDAMTPEQLGGWLSLAFKRVLTGQLEPRVGTALAAIAKTLLDVETAAAQPSVDDLRDQVATLRAMIERGGGRGAA